MKIQSIHHHLGGLGTALILSTAASHAGVTVDGTRNVGEGYVLLANQATVSNWTDGGQEALANIYAVQDGNDLAVQLAARVQNRGIILFIDSRAGGRTFIPNNLINYGGEENNINNLGTDSANGMTFETGFEPDYAIRIYGDGGTGAFVNTYNLNAGTRTDAGNAGAADISSTFISVMRAYNLGSGTNVNSADYSVANEGVEMKLNLAALGVPSGNQTVKLMAVLVNGDSTYGSNQVLASRTSTTTDIGGGINSINFQSETGTQTLSQAVTGPASRSVVFNVDMTDEIAKGNFIQGTDKVKVLFFSGSASPTPGSMFLTDPENDKIYSGTLVTTGTENDPFGTYKFFNTHSGAPNSGYEYGDDWNFTLAALDSTQNLPTVIFRTNSFSLWSNTYSGGETANQDHDGDGVKNVLEYFMGSNNSEFTPNPQVVTIAGVRTISWPHDVNAAGVTYKVSTSDDLSTWTDVTANSIDSAGTLKYTLPSGPLKSFVRLEVTTP